MTEKYTIGKWGDLPNYECKLCPFSTVHKEVIEQHLVERHSPSPPPPLRRPVVVYDRFGNRISTGKEVS